MNHSKYDKDIADIEKNHPVFCPLCKSKMKMYNYPKRPLPSEGNRLYGCTNETCMLNISPFPYNLIFDGDIPTCEENDNAEDDDNE